MAERRAKPKRAAEEPVLPHSLESEAAVLGAILLSNAAYDRAVRHVTAASFYRVAHREIWTSIARLLERPGGAVDLALLKEDLGAHQQLDAVGGASYIAALVDGVPRSTNVEHYARIVQDKALLRACIAVGQQLVTDAYIGEDPASTLIMQADQAIVELQHGARTERMRSLASTQGDFLDHLQWHIDHKGELTGVETGFAGVNEMTLGWQPSDLIVVAARPSIGKSSFYLNTAFHAAESPRADGTLRRVALFSMEMRRQQLEARLLASLTNIDLSRIAGGYIRDDEWPKVTEALSRMRDADIHIDDTASRTVLDVRAECRRLKSDGGLDLVGIDYIQLMPGTLERRGATRNEEVTHISRTLKMLADDLSVPFLVLSQLNRASEGRSDPRPRLSDLRESGCVAGDTLVYQPTTGLCARIDSFDPVHTVAALTGTHMTDTHPSKVFASGVKPTYKLTTGSGRVISATANHRFLTPDGWQRLDRLDHGQTIAVPSRLPGPSFPVEIMTRSELALLAHLIGNGCVLPSHSVQYTTADEDVAVVVSHCAQDVFGAAVAPRMNAEGRHGEAPTWFQVYLRASYHLTHRVRNPVIAWWVRLGLDLARAPQKRVPDAVFRQSQESIAWFLKHLWSTDGTVVTMRRPTRGRGIHQGRLPPRDRVIIMYATCSTQLAEDVHNLLLRVGIKSHIRRVDQGTKGRPQHHVTVCGLTGKRRFIDLIGCVGQRREERVRLAGVVLDAAGLGVAYDGDIYWDRIRSIEAEPARAVYDLTVPGFENFIANGIVVHNSIEQDSDVVLFLHRKNHRLSGTTQAIFEKQRNGPTGSLNLTLTRETCLFTDGGEDPPPATPEEQATETKARKASFARRAHSR